MLCKTSSWMDLGKLTNAQTAALLEREGVRGLKAFSVALTSVHINFRLLQPCTDVADASQTLVHEGFSNRCTSIRKWMPHESLRLLKRLPAMSANGVLTEHREQVVNVLMGVAHHSEIHGHSAELLHAHEMAAEGGCILIIGLCHSVVRLED